MKNILSLILFVLGGCLVFCFFPPCFWCNPIISCPLFLCGFLLVVLFMPITDDCVLAMEREKEYMDKDKESLIAELNNHRQWFIQQAIDEANGYTFNSNELEYREARIEEIEGKLGWYSKEKADNGNSEKKKP